MKNVILTIIYCFVFLAVNAQDGIKFDVQKTDMGVFLVKSTEEVAMTEGNIGKANVVDQKGVNDLIKSATKEVLTKEKLQTLHSASSYVLFVNPDGRVLNCIFNIDVNDINMFTDSDYLTIYNNLKKLVFSTDLVKIVPYPYDSPDSKICYGLVHGSFLTE